MKPQIIATIGPASSDRRTLKEMIKAGMSVVRINFSHGKHKDIERYCKDIKQISATLHKQIKILADLQGPKIRIGKIKSEPILLETGKTFILTTRPIIGTKKSVSVDYKELHRYVSKNDKIFLDDGKIELKVAKVQNEKIICKIIIGGALSSRKGLNLYRKTLPLPAVTDEDKRDAIFAVNHCGIRYFAQSFVRKPEDVLELKKIIASVSNSLQNFHIIAKIEDYEGYKNIDKIIKVADGIMVARGDLGVSVERALVPLIQKEIIEKCNSARKPDIVTTQMLESMIYNPYPTRAEINDVAVAVMQGADYLMLSAETAVGKYPVTTIREMNQTINKVTKYLLNKPN